ncbi:MAG TPA: hypothetical protein VJT67_13505, partial [Longimicrobiaceae bacterium]|nr:hypothetical protein [Longimicrobiaceae bacterium]
WTAGESIDSVNHIPVMPEAAAMSRARRCGIVAGTRPIDPDSLIIVYIDSGRVYQLRQKIPSAVRGVWVDEQCTDGWAVGRNGFLSHVRFTRPGHSYLTSEAGSSIEKLAGEYRLPVLATSDSVVLDSMQLVSDGRSVVLHPTRDFTSERVSRDTLKLEFTDSVGDRATSLTDRSVRLRFFVASAVSTPAYVTAYERAGTFTYSSTHPWRKYAARSLVMFLAMNGLGLLYFLGSIAFIRLAVKFPAPRELLLRPRDSYRKSAWADRLLSISTELVFISARIRAALFTDYRANARKWYSSAPAVAAGLRVETPCRWLSRQQTFPDSDTLYTEFRKEPTDRVLWIQRESGTDCGPMLRGITHTALQRDDTAFLVTVDEPEPVIDIVGREMYRYGRIPRDAGELIDRGEHVLILNVVGEGDEVTKQVRTFVENFRLRNAIIVSSGAKPVQDACVVRVVPARKPPQTP